MEIPAATIASWAQLGFAVGVAWYLLTQALPRSEARAEKRDTLFLDALEKQHADHADEIKSLTAHHEKQTDRVIDAIHTINANGHDRNSRG